MGDSERECAEKMVDHFLTMVCSSHRLRKES